MFREAKTASTGWMSPGQATARYANGLAATMLAGLGFFWFGWGLGRAMPAAWRLWLALYAATAILLWVAVRSWRAGKASLCATGAEAGAVSWQHDPGAFRRLLRAEAYACGLVVMLCLVTWRWNWLAAGIALVVGLHFLPLARLFRFPAYHATGIAIVVCVVYDAVHFEGVDMIGAVGATTGTVMWLTAIFMLLHRRRTKGMPRAAASR